MKPSNNHNGVSFGEEFLNGKTVESSVSTLAVLARYQMEIVAVVEGRSEVAGT